MCLYPGKARKNAIPAWGQEALRGATVNTLHSEDWRRDTGGQGPLQPKAGESNDRRVAP